MQPPAHSAIKSSATEGQATRVLGGEELAAGSLSSRAFHVADGRTGRTAQHAVVRRVPVGDTVWTAAARSPVVETTWAGIDRASRISARQ